MTKLEASQLVAVLFGSYANAHLDRTHVDAYVSGILDLNAQPAAEAVTRLRRTSRFLPSIAEIREACAAQTHGAARTGEEAYAELTAAVRRHGRDYGQGAAKFRDPLIAKCLGVWGSWNDLCSSPTDDPGGRARFVELYDELASRQRQDLAAGGALPAANDSPAFWLERPKARAEARSLPLAQAPVGDLLAVLAPRKPANHGQAQTPRRWTAEELDAALAGGAK